MGDGEGQAAHVVRATVLMSTTFAFALAAHAWGGGPIPSTLGLATLGALTVAVCTAVARYRAQTWWLVGFLGLLQLALHHGFAFFTAPTGGVASAGAVEAHHTVTAVPPGTSETVHAGGHAMGTAMLAAHAAAVVVTAVLLGAAERAARLAHTVWSTLLPVLLGLFRPVTQHRPHSPGVTAPEPAALSRLVGSVAPRRGPPPVVATIA